MRKFWRIGLILVIGLSACGDKKAEQAKTLQQEMQEHAGQGGQQQQQDVHLWRRHGDAGRRRLRGHRRQGGGHDSGGQPRRSREGHLQADPGRRRHPQVQRPDLAAVADLKDPDGKQVKITDGHRPCERNLVEEAGPAHVRRYPAEEPGGQRADERVEAGGLRRPLSAAIQGQRAGRLRSDRQRGRQAAHRLGQGRAILRRRPQVQLGDRRRQDRRADRGARRLAEGGRKREARRDAAAASRRSSPS